MRVTLRSRSQWGAAPPRDRPTRISRPVRELWLHHTVTNRYGDGGMRHLQQIAFGRGFDDISYSWVYDPRNRVFYVGRGPAVQGAHTAGRNSFSHAVSLIGNFQRDRLSDGNLDDLAAFCRLHKARGWGPGQFTGGHRDLKSTACPGDNAYAAIGEINRRARSSSPPPPPPAAPIEGTIVALPIRKGDKGHDVRYVQRLIRDCGVAVDLDDHYGSHTAEALARIVPGDHPGGVINRVGGVVLARLQQEAVKAYCEGWWARGDEHPRGLHSHDA